MRTFKMTHDGVDYVVRQEHDDAPATVITAAGLYVTMVWPFPGENATEAQMEAVVAEHMTTLARSRH